MFIIMVLFEPINEGFALSPAFPIQGISLPADAWHLIDDVESPTTNMTQCKEGGKHIPFPSIDAVNYYSDGKVLFTTLWLSSQFKPVQNMTELYRSYAFFIVPSSIYNNTQTYEVTLEWNVTHPNIWTRKYHEWSPIAGFDKVLLQENVSNNYLGSFETGKNYVDLSMDLGASGYPTQYSVVSYEKEVFIRKDGFPCSLIDITDAVHIPPPEYVLSALPNSFVLRPGGENKIELQLKSNSSMPAEVFFSSEPIDGLNSTIVPEEAFVSSLGLATSTLYIKALDNATYLPHTLRVNAKTTIPIKVMNQVTQTIGPSLDVRSITKNTDVIITIQPPLTIPEQINSFLTYWVNPFTGAYSVIATIGTGILGWRIGKRKSRSK